MKVEIESPADVCTLFADAVKEGKYRKMDYGLWRKWVTKKNKAMLKFTKDSVTLTSDYTFDTFKRNDRGFGDFLYDMYFSTEEEKTMEPKNIATIPTVVYPGDAVTFSNHTIKADASCYATVGTINDMVSKVDFDALIEKINAISAVDTNKTNNEEKKEMKNFNFDFGKVMDSQARISMYGIAVKNPSGTWVAYDSKSESMMDVDILNFEGMDALYKMPVALNQVAAGDVIIHNGRPCFVVSFEENGNSFHVIDIYGGEVKDILPAKSPFGFSFVTKIVSLFNFGGTADATNPFGNMLPFFLMKDGNKNDMLPMLMLANGGKMDAAMANPMMLMLLMNDSADKNDVFKMLAFAQMFNQPKA